jgi:hypothetical protein
MRHRTDFRRARRGFSTTELSIVVVLMVFLAALVSSVWKTFGSPIARVTARSMLAREADLAITALVADLDGRLDNPLPAAQSPYSLVGRIPSSSAPSWRLLENTAPLQLCFDGSPQDGVPDWGAPGGVDTVMTYTLQGDALVRTVENGGPTTVLARKVQSFVVTAIDNQGTQDASGRWLRIDLTLQYGSYRRLYRLVAYGP